MRSLSKLGDDARLVFDLGMHEGEDVAYYIQGGLRVVAVEADHRLVDRARETFAENIREGRLRLEHAAVVETAGGIVEFHLSQNTLWNSISAPLANREGLGERTVTAPTVDLPTLIRRYGLPGYCKIDLEGGDAAALAGLAHAPELPRFISAETECLGSGDDLDESNPFAVLDQLQAVGYTHFKLVDQRSLVVLPPNRSFYPRAERFHPPIADHERRRFDRFRDPYLRNSRRLARRTRFRFEEGASGPFGPELDGTWLAYDSARATLLHHRRDYFAMGKAVPHGFWCDWHATLA